MRWNYIRWLQDLVDTTSPDYTEALDPSRHVHGLDIGIGASCIYALLACVSRPHWHMHGTDIDAHSLSFATRNVESNSLAARIHLTQSAPLDPLLPLDALGISTLDFVMTNPPFYSSDADMAAAYDGTNRSAPPSAVCTGAANEMICPDGDAGFVTRMLQESLALRTRVQWYSAMFGRLQSLRVVVERLKAAGVRNWAVTDLQAGRRTKRWAVAWSFGDLRVRNDVGRHGALVKDVLPETTAQSIVIGGMEDVRELGKLVNEAMRELQGVVWEWKPLHDAGILECRENVWSRAARRKRKFKPDAAEGDEMDDEAPVALAVKVMCKVGEVEVRWLRGLDRNLFTSFCAMLKTALTGDK